MPIKLVLLGVFTLIIMIEFVVIIGDGIDKNVTNQHVSVVTSTIISPSILTQYPFWVDKVTFSYNSGVTNGNSLKGSISSNCRFVVYSSEAKNLVIGKPSSKSGLGLFVYDRFRGETRSILSNGYKNILLPFVLDDKYLAYMVQPFSPNKGEMYWYNLETNDNIAIYPQLINPLPRFFANGKFVIFSDYQQKSYIYNGQINQTSSVGSGYSSSISADGKFIAYMLIKNNKYYVGVTNLETNQQTILPKIDPTTVDSMPQISGNGQVILYKAISYTNNIKTLFAHDMKLNETSFITSVNEDASENKLIGSEFNLSDNGKLSVFESNGWVYLYNLDTHETIKLIQGESPYISNTGSCVVYHNGQDIYAAGLEPRNQETVTMTISSITGGVLRWGGVAIEFPEQAFSHDATIELIHTLPKPLNADKVDIGQFFSLVMNEVLQKPITITVQYTNAINPLELYQLTNSGWTITGIHAVNKNTFILANTLDTSIDFAIIEPLSKNYLPLINKEPSPTPTATVTKTPQATTTFTPSPTTMPTITYTPSGTPSPTVTPRPTNTSEPSGPCSCSTDRYNCDDFGSQGEAQICFRWCVSLGHGDIHNLDGNNNGVACESN